MSNFNINLNNENKYDAIVIGSGMSGGWAAKELCEKGLKTLVLEKGRMVNHITDYPTASMDVWELPNHGGLTHKEKEEHSVQMRTGFLGSDTVNFFNNDKKNPYIEEKPFDWIRGNQVGGRSLLWGKQVYRWSDLDFEANAREGIAVDWPIRYKDIEPWYTYVEKFVGVSGEKLGLSHVPDGYFQPPMDLNCIEKHFRAEVEKNYKKNRVVTIGRVAHLTDPQPIHLALGRGKCQNRNRCSRGCPFGAYFSSNSATLPAANNTGNMSIRPNSIVHSIILDENTNLAKGVRVIDSETKKVTEFYAKIIFCCASTLGTSQILLNSTSNRFPNGMGNDSGELGHNLMDHHYRVGATGEHDEYKDQYYKGRRPNGIFIPKYVNLDYKTKQKDFVRGWDYQGGGHRSEWGDANTKEGVGAAFKDGLFKPDGWKMNLMGFGECLPYHENKAYLHKEQKDEWGIPLLVLSAEFKDNEWKMREKMQSDAAEMLESSGFKNIKPFDNPSAMGIGIHEMGTARMGLDPKTSVLNGNNQIHAVPNVFVTDGACMTSANCVNPSITYMALTARATNFAVEELKKGNF